jgi:integrase
MRIEISESHYKAMCEVAKSIPTELAAKGTKSKNGNERIVVECRQGPLMAGDGRCGGNYITAIVRWHMLESCVQRGVQRSCRRLGFDIKPHELRHAYATHCLNGGQNPRAIQQAMGHKSLDTTMGYLHAEAMSVRSPLEVLT